MLDRIGLHSIFLSADFAEDADGPVILILFILPILSLLTATNVCKQQDRMGRMNRMTSN